MATISDLRAGGSISVTVGGGHRPAEDPATWPLVGDYDDWESLGVHHPIVLGANDTMTGVQLPAYVLRDNDEAQLRPALRVMDSDPPVSVRLVLITGESTAGKSRAALEAMRTVLPHWRLLHPAGPHRLRTLLDAGVRLPRTVVWLDELQELLAHPDGPGLLRELLELPHGPAVLLATIRTDAEIALENTTIGRHLAGRSARFTRITLTRRATASELERAGSVADSRIRQAVGKAGEGYGIAEWLAAGPQLANRLERARTSEDPVRRCGQAIVRAAVCCYRAGFVAPLPENLLTEVFRLYTGDDPIATGSSAAVFGTALEWARAPVAGAAGLLVHREGWGDRPFDYLIDTVDDARAPIPRNVWSLLSPHLTAATLPTVVLAAHRAGVRDVADELLQRVTDRDRIRLAAALGDRETLAIYADQGAPNADRYLTDLLVEEANLSALVDITECSSYPDYAQERLAELLVAHHDVQTLINRADADDRAAEKALGRLRFREDDISELTAHANAGDEVAEALLAELLATRGDLEALAERAAWADRFSSRRIGIWRGHLHILVDQLVKKGDIEAITARADAGDEYAAEALVDLLVEQNDLESLIAHAEEGRWTTEAARGLNWLLRRRGDIEALTAHADAGDADARSWLAHLLAEQGDVAALTARADRDDHDAARRLARLLAERGDAVALTSRADAGDSAAADELAELLAARGDVVTLTARANRGCRAAAARRAKLLAEQGDVEGLTEQADAGDEAAADELITLLARRRDIGGLAARADGGDESAGAVLAGLLGRRGDRERLTARADAGDEHARHELTRLLERRSDIEALDALAAGGDLRAGEAAARILVRRGDVEALAARADTGDDPARHGLLRLLARQGDEEGLAARADAGDLAARSELAELLARQGDLETLTVRADSGDEHAAFVLAAVLAHTDTAALRSRVDAGDQMALNRLTDYLVRQEDVDGLASLADSTGNFYPRRELAQLLAEKENAEELEYRADLGDRYATMRLVELEAERGELGRLTGLADGGDRWSGDLLIKHLLLQGNLQEAINRALAGDRSAMSWLVRLMATLGPRIANRGRRRREKGIRIRKEAMLQIGPGEAISLLERRATGDPDAARIVEEEFAREAEMNRFIIRSYGGPRFYRRLARALTADPDFMRALRKAGQPGWRGRTSRWR